MRLAFPGIAGTTTSASAQLGGAGTSTEPVATRRRRWATAGVLAVWAALVAVALVWGAAGGAGRGSRVGAAPFMGRWREDPTWRVLPAVGIALLAVGLWPGTIARLRWRQVVAGSGVLAVVWAVALNFTDGPRALTAPLETPFEYLRWVPSVGSPGEFLRTFVDRLPREPTHVKSHPPGMVLVLWGLDHLGLGGSGPAAVLILAAVGAAVVAVLVALRDVAGEGAARRAAPFVALLPAAVWMATSPDAFFLGVTACGVAAVVTATSRAGPRSHRWAGVGGLLLGAGLFLSYGMAALLAVPAAVVAARRRWVVLLPAAAAITLVVAVFAAAGFWWPEGLAATHERHTGGVVVRRADGYFLLANLAVLAVAVGPAVAVGLSRVWNDRRFLLCGAALVTLLVIDVSGLSEGEVERIWLPFVPWVATAASALGSSEGSQRGWLALQVATGVVLQLVLRSPW